MPFDDSREGCLENLLDTCIKNKFDFFNNCWELMLECIKESEIKELNIPGQKALLYSKLDLIKKHRKENWSKDCYDYSDENIWEIDHNKNKELKKLLDFIDKNLFND